MAGGLAVVVFAIASALKSTELRNLGGEMQQVDIVAETGDQRRSTSTSTADN